MYQWLRDGAGHIVFWVAFARRISLADACGAQASLLLEYLPCVA